MKKVIGIALVVAVVLAVFRRFGPALRDRAMARCQEMFERVSGERAHDQDREHVVSATGG
jgi:hypothetical protein